MQIKFATQGFHKPDCSIYKKASLKNGDYVSAHLLADFYGVPELSGKEYEEILAEATTASGATLISTHSHNFEGQGTSAVALLKESHISAHTWPEFEYVGLDIFLCGEADPGKALHYLRKALHPKYEEVVRVSRGRPRGLFPDLFY